MNPPKTSISLFRRLRVVLIETSRAGNVGAAARAMKTMGFSKLVLVNPRNPQVLEHEEAIAFASGAQDILANARIAASLGEALEGCNFAAALTARPREFSPPILYPRALAEHLVETPGFEAALVFGNERFGLSNEDVEKCNALISIPANPDYSSLNLAQAVQVLMYECRLASIGDTVLPSSVGFQGDAASIPQIDGMYQHLENALIKINFLDPDSPKKLMPRLRRLFSRTQLEVEEVNILRGIAKQILKQDDSKN